MKTETTMYQLLLATGACERHATAFLEELKLEKDQVLPFEPGTLLMTDGVQMFQAMGLLNSLPYLIRHLCGDWGNLLAAEQLKNLQSLQSGGILFSTYYIGENDETCLHICTTRCRTRTLVLLADEFDLISFMHTQQ